MGICLTLNGPQSFLPYYFFGNENYLSVLRELEPNGQVIYPKSSEAIRLYLEAKLPPGTAPQTAKKLSRQILDLSFRHGFPPNFILSLMEVESAYRSHAVSSRGAIGILQIKRSTADDLIRRHRIPAEGRDLYDPLLNVELALLYLQELRDRFRDPRHYITAYNHGPSRLSKILSNGQALPDQYYNKVMTRFQLAISNQPL